ncbi:MAG: hypothetical protein WAW39_11435 [Prosthecobacter sp.]|uniref:hypothetical protein n=1 Tax=Prosthecobacter sp. TaxID=1965333 RepID=UPI003BAFC96C
MASPAIICAAIGRLTTAAALTVPVWSIAGQADAYLVTGPEPVLVLEGKVSGEAVCGLSMLEPLLKAEVLLESTGFTLTVVAEATIGNSVVGLTVWDVALDIYGLFRIEVKSPTALDLARTRILAAINSVMQLIWSRADKLNYFNQEQLEVTVATGTSEIALSNDVQSVIGPVSAVGGKTLSPIPSREALLNYVDYWFGGSAPAIQPPAYWVNCAQDLQQGDRTSIKITLPWATSADYVLNVDVVKSVLRFTEADMINAAPIRLPAKYVELLFLPLLREWAANDYLFKSETARPGIAAAASAAKESLGLLEPSPSIVKKTNQGDSTP